MLCYLCNYKYVHVNLPLRFIPPLLSFTSPVGKWVLGGAQAPTYMSAYKNKYGVALQLRKGM